MIDTAWHRRQRADSFGFEPFPNENRPLSNEKNNILL